MRVRIGLSMSPREIELDVEDAEAIAEAVESALGGGGPVVWVTDRHGVRHGVVADKIAFIEIEAQDGKRGVGFSTD